MKYLSILLILATSIQAQALSLAPLMTESQYNKSFMCEVNRQIISELINEKPNPWLAGSNIRVRKARSILKAVASKKECRQLAQRLGKAPCQSVANKFNKIKKNIAVRFQFTLYDVADTDQGVELVQESQLRGYHSCRRR